MGIPTEVGTTSTETPIRVLLAEDDPSLRLLFATGLELEGFEVELANDGVAAAVAFDPARHDAVIADLMMPRGSGMSVLRVVRKQSDVPFLIMSAWHDGAHRVVALEEGADDFIAKPFEPRELALRIESLVRGRSSGRTHSSSITWGPLEIEPEHRTATLAGRPLDLTGLELDLLIVLAESPEKVFSRTDLLSLVWSSNPEWQSVDTVTEHIYRLRKKLARDPEGANLILTVRGAGYRLAA